MGMTEPKRLGLAPSSKGMGYGLGRLRRPLGCGPVVIKFVLRLLKQTMPNSVPASPSSKTKKVAQSHPFCAYSKILVLDYF